MLRLILPALVSCDMHLDGSAGDEEPLVNAWVDRSRGLVVALRDVELGVLGTLRRVRDGGVGATGTCQNVALET